jgi:hypothetical protein
MLSLIRFLAMAGIAASLTGCISVSTVKKDPAVTTTETTTTQRPVTATETTTTRTY